jgi:hypothetical protein
MLVKSEVSYVANIIGFPKPRGCVVIPLPDGMCRVKLDIKMPMAEAIEMMKVMGFFNIRVDPVPKPDPDRT